MSKKHVRHHFDSMFGPLLTEMTSAEKAAFKGITLNGTSFDTLWMSPFELDVTDVVKPGKNTLKV